jgi:hypothetical protein
LFDALPSFLAGNQFEAMKILRTIFGFVACTACYVVAGVVAMVVVTTALWLLAIVGYATLHFLNSILS